MKRLMGPLAIASIMVTALFAPTGARALSQQVRGSGTLTGVLAQGGLLVEFACTADAEGGAAFATRINACLLEDSAGHVLAAANPIATPQAAVTAARAVVKVVPKVCWNVSAVFLNNAEHFTGGCAGSLTVPGPGGGGLPGGLAGIGQSAG